MTGAVINEERLAGLPASFGHQGRNEAPLVQIPTTQRLRVLPEDVLLAEELGQAHSAEVWNDATVTKAYGHDEQLSSSLFKHTEEPCEACNALSASEVCYDLLACHAGEYVRSISHCMPAKPWQLDGGGERRVKIKEDAAFDAKGLPSDTLATTAHASPRLLEVHMAGRGSLEG